MKRLALLLAAMGIISATALAEAPVLKVTNVGQELEIDNTSGGLDIGESAQLYNTVGLQYGDWTFGVTGAKFWTVDTEAGIHSDGGRLQIDVWKKTTDNLKLGFRYRGQKNYDRYQFRYDYSNGWFWSASDVWYQANNADATDNVEMELFPFGVKYGALKAGWFVNYYTAVGNISNDDVDQIVEHQLRVYANLYKSEKLSLDAEYRLTLSYDKDIEGGKKLAGDNTEFKSFERNRLYLGATYSVTENLDIYGKYGYEIGEKEYIVDGKECNDGKYYGEFVVGWNYKF